VDFRPSESQQLLAATARDFLRKQCPPERIDELAGDARAARELWRAMAELGWTGLLIPGELGGSDGAILDVILLMEEMGRVCLPGPFVDSAVVATSLLAAGADPALRRRLLPAMARGDRVCALAWLDESGDASPEATAVRLEANRLTGQALFVRGADRADDLLVAARGHDGVSLILIERARAGVEIAPIPSMASEPSFEVAFSGVDVKASEVVGTPGRAGDALAAALRLGALACSAEMVGCAQRILELTVEYAKSRVQSGRPIGSFQAIQHACADLLRGVESARPLVQCAAWKAQEGLDCAGDVAMAKSYASETCLAVARKAHQIFGAISYCDEHPLHRFHKRILAARLAYGEPAHHQEVVARALGLAD
jgi:alkylation response protein AidB-like acyl-CoA dehydrogenase